MAFLEWMDRWWTLLLEGGLGLAMVILGIYMTIIKIQDIKSDGFSQLGWNLGKLAGILLLIAMGVFVLYVEVQAFLDSDYWCENFSGVTRSRHCIGY